MTMQVAMVGTDGIVLASDTCWNLTTAEGYYGTRQTSSSSKVIVGGGGVAAIALARNMETSAEIARLIMSEMNVPQWSGDPVERMEVLARGVLSTAGGRDDVQLVVVLSRPKLCLFVVESRGFGSGDLRVTCRPIQDKIVCGDVANSAYFWAQKYYRRTDTNYLIQLAAQLITDAHTLNPTFVDGLELVICGQDGVRRLEDAENSALREGAERRTEQIAAIFRA